MGEIVSRAALIEILEKDRPAKLGFTSGSFDLLHPGHVDYLKAAKEKCDCLLVGLNSDRSVKEYKSKLRPIMPEDARIKVLAGLESVDYVFLFDETNNNKNIELIKPDFYIKAGDYNKEKLSSAKIIEAYGGEVVLIDIEEEYSSSEIINSVLEKYSAKIQEYIPKETPSASKALILDRDGTIIKHRDYLFDPELVELLPDAAQGIKKFQDDGYKILIVTNQPGIDFGYFDFEKMFQVNKRMLTLLNEHGILVDKIYFSPYTKAARTDCRKPGTALIKRAQKELNLVLEECIVIGDMDTDIAMGEAVGARTYLVSEDNKSILDAYEALLSP